MQSRAKRMRAVEAESADTAREQVMAQLDLFSSRLDLLKRAYNDVAKELAAMPSAPSEPDADVDVDFDDKWDEVTPVRVVATPGPVVPRPDPRPGRYAIQNPVDPQPIRLVTPPKPEHRTKSGRFYLQLSGANNPEELRKVREDVSKHGRIVDSGCGTASDPQAGWLEVAVRAADTGEFVLKLDELDMRSRVEKLIEVAPGEGRLQSKQLDLFGHEVVTEKLNQ